MIFNFNEMFKLHISYLVKNCCDKCEHFAVCQVGQIPRLTFVKAKLHQHPNHNQPALE